MKVQTLYAIKKGGKYLSGIFCDPLEFEARKPGDSYLYSVERIARDIASKEGATVEAIRADAVGRPV